MADAAKPNPRTEDDMHWGIAYLREDLQELRLGQRSRQDRMDNMNRDLTARMDSINESLIARMDAMSKDLSVRMDSRFALMLTTMIGLTGITIGANFAFLRMYLP